MIADWTVHLGVDRYIFDFLKFWMDLCNTLCIKIRWKSPIFKLNFKIEFQLFKWILSAFSWCEKSQLSICLSVYSCFLLSVGWTDQGWSVQPVAQNQFGAAQIRFKILRIIGILTIFLQFWTYCGSNYGKRRTAVQRPTWVGRHWIRET